MKYFTPLLLSVAFLVCSCNQSKKELVSKNDSVEISNSPFKIFPVDEKNKDNSLCFFLEKLKKAVSEKDTLQLFALMDTNIVISYGGGIQGYRGLSCEYKLAENNAASTLWKELKYNIELGGTFDDNSTYCLPYYNSQRLFTEKIVRNNPKIQGDPYTTFFCSSPKIAVFEKRDSTCTPIIFLNYDAVVSDYNSPQDNNFLKFQTMDGKNKGYSLKRYFYCEANRKILVGKSQKNQWTIISFAPFD